MSKNGTRHNPYKGLKRTLRAKGLRYEDVAELLDRELGLGGRKLLQENAGSWLLAGETKGGISHV